MAHHFMVLDQTLTAHLTLNTMTPNLEEFDTPIRHAGITRMPA
jgi:hypothetical protein